MQRYLAMLQEEGLLAAPEVALVQQALRGLEAPLAAVSDETVQAVREELGRPGWGKRTVRELESHHWRRSLAAGLSPLPGHDLERSLALFRVQAAQDPARTVRFLRQSDARPLPSYVPPQLRQAETFYWLLLRMCRRQREELRPGPSWTSECAARASLPPEAPPPAAPALAPRPDDDAPPRLGPLGHFLRRFRRPS